MSAPQRQPELRTNLKLTDAPRRSDPITAWLDSLSMVLKLPRDQREGVREELAGHLKDRVRDLMLSGAPEAQASQTALEELGDAVKLAHRLQAASRSPARRLAMNLSVIGVASAALITSVIALRAGAPQGAPPGGPPDSSAATGQRVVTSIMPAQATTVPDDVQKVRLSQDADATWGSFFKQVSDKSKLPVDVRWRLFEAQGWSTGEVMHTSFRDMSLPLAVKFINEEVAGDGRPLDYRVLDGRLVFATQEYFDQQETVLVAYDLSKQVADRARDNAAAPRADIITNASQSAAAAVTSEVRAVLTHMVFPEGWQDNGGNMGTMAVFGSKLFIKAPKRYHAEIQWVINELPKSADHATIDRDLNPADPRRASVEADDSVPVLGDLPVLSNQFRSTAPVEASVGPGPITVRGLNGAPVEVEGARGKIKANNVRVKPTDQPAPTTDPASTSPAPQPRLR
jgi:hypothetical protein